MLVREELESSLGTWASQYPVSCGQRFMFAKGVGLGTAQCDMAEQTRFRGRN